MGLTTFVVSTVVTNLFEGKPPLDISLFWNISSDLLSWVCCILLMVLYSSIAYLFQRCIVNGFVAPDSYSAHICQHIMSSLLFVGAFFVIFHMNWPIIQTSAYILEMEVIFMKMHSYIMTNRTMALKANTPNIHISSGGEPKVKYPKNCTLSNYMDYLFCPTLVYECEYPRLKQIRVSYILEKIVATIACLVCIYTITAHYILPPLKQLNQYSALHTIFKLITPFTLNYVLIFYLVFECLCNAFAELTRFADREFYEDWWNSSTFDEYARKWNKPVHEFLKRHIYSYTREKLKDKNMALYITFFFSALLHELVLIGMFRMIRPYLLVMMMTQIPLIYLGNLPLFRNIPRLGNLSFWFGLGVGPSILAILYTREYLLLVSSVQ